MSLALKTAVVQHALDVSQLYKDNCALTRGLPQALPRLRIADQEDTEPTPPASVIPPQQSTTAPVGTQQPATGGATQQQSSGWLKPALVTAATLLGGAGVGAGAVYLLRPDETNVTIEQPGDASLLQYLQDQGMHLSPDKRGVP